MRAMHLAKKMGIKVDRVCVVPPGRGHLTNAFASSRTVALTDNFGEYLYGPELDYVICHELAHGKNKHMRKKLSFLVALYSLLALFSFIFAAAGARYHPLLLMIVLILPLLIYYAISRRFEYQADLDAVQVIGDPQAGMRALCGALRQDRYTY